VAIWSTFAALELFTTAGVAARWLGWAFWATVAIIQATQLLPGAAYLKLSDAGFEVRSSFRQWSCRWDDVVAFEVVRPFGFGAIVTFRLVPGAPFSVMAPALSRWMTRRDGILPDSYRMSPEALVLLLNEYKARSGRITK
jgi:hypothetical protein